MIVGRGEKRRICKSLTEAPVKDTFSIAFDGNHMESIICERNGNKVRNIKVKKEVIVITDMDNEEYIGNVQVDSGKGRRVAIAMMEVFSG